MANLMERFFKVKQNDEKVNTIVVKLYYRRDAGYNYWNGNRQERGYLLSVTPTEIKECDRYATHLTIGRSGVNIMLREVNRKSAKVERELLEELTDDKIKEYIRRYVPEYELEETDK